MIPDDATTLAYYSALRSVPRIVRVVRFTPTTVLIENGNHPFRRDNGKQKGGYTSGGHVAVVTPEVLDHIAAAEKQPRITELRARVSEAFDAKARKRIDAAIALRHETKLIAAESTIDKLEALLAEAEQP